jgi:tetratricopeptide (TPR) repeat protein
MNEQDDDTPDLSALSTNENVPGRVASMWFLRADASTKRGDHLAAMNESLMAAAHAPNDSAMLSRAVLGCCAAHRYEIGLIYALRLVELFPKYAHSHSLLADCYGALGQPFLALVQATEAVNMDGDEPHYAGCLAQAHVECGDDRAAERIFSRLVRAGTILPIHRRFYSRLLARQQRFAEAAEVADSPDLLALGDVAVTEAAVAYMNAGRGDKTRELLTRVVEAEQDTATGARALELLDGLS